MGENCGAWLEDESGDVHGLTRRECGGASSNDLGGHARSKYLDCNRSSRRCGLLCTGHCTCPGQHEPGNESCDVACEPMAETAHICFSLRSKVLPNRHEMAAEWHIYTTTSRPTGTAPRVGLGAAPLSEIADPHSANELNPQVAEPLPNTTQQTEDLRVAQAYGEATPALVAAFSHADGDERRAIVRCRRIHCPDMSRDGSWRHDS